MPAVKVLMNREEPPTFKDLMDIPWVSTRQLGVYLKLIFESLENPTAFDHFVYLGSAIGWDVGGLNHHRRWHESKPGPRTKWSYTHKLVFGKKDASRSSVRSSKWKWTATSPPSRKRRV
ncbi:hypothetical protein BDV32DRAFT_155220 [Aspergillus pseudonomiae]|nr:hypothetical protein BDV32DRAFT_155220 [Aspergillus pseudonomiae]